MKVKLITLFLLIINIIFLSMILFIVESREVINFSLTGDNPYFLDLEQEYKEPGFVAEKCQRKHCEKLKVTITDNKEENPNDYEIKYSFKHKNKDYVLFRTVKSIDTTPPAIELKGSEKTIICPGKEYKEEGFTATDNVDGDLTSVVSRREEKNKIIYSVEDSSKNKTETTRTITSEDKTKPVIKLKGSETMTLYVGSTYKEPGYTATDNCAGNITSKVKVTKDINTNKVGTYKVTYTVTDRYQNETIIKRTILIKERPKSVVETADKAALTKYIKQKKYNVSVGYYNLVTGDTYYYQPGKVYFGASLVKTVDAMYIYEKTNPSAATIAKVKKAISISDNNAHMQLVNQIGRDKLKAYGKSLGATHFLTSTTNLYYGDTTVYDQMVFWKHLYKVIKNNPKGSELKSFFINTYGNYLRFDGIPTTMHKYGRQSQYYHDVGLIFSKQPYIVVILTKHGNSNFKTIIKDLSEKIYAYNRIDN